MAHQDSPQRLAPLCGINELPDAVLLKIFVKLCDVEEVMLYSSVCSKWRTLAKQTEWLTLYLGAEDGPLTVTGMASVVNLLGELTCLKKLKMQAPYWLEEVDCSFLAVIVQTATKLQKFTCEAPEEVLDKFLSTENSAVLLSFLTRLPLMEKVCLTRFAFDKSFQRIIGPRKLENLWELYLFDSIVSQAGLVDIFAACPKLAKLALDHVILGESAGGHLTIASLSLQVLFASNIKADPRVVEDPNITLSIDTPLLKHATIANGGGVGNVVFMQQSLGSLTLDKVVSIRAAEPLQAVTSLIVLFGDACPLSSWKGLLASLPGLKRLTLSYNEEVLNESSLLGNQLKIGELFKGLMDLKELIVTDPFFYRNVTIPPDFEVLVVSECLPKLEYLELKLHDAACLGSLDWFLKSSPDLKVVKIDDATSGDKSILNCL